MRFTHLAVAAAMLACGAGASAQDAAPAAPAASAAFAAPAPGTAAQPPSGGEGARELPVFLFARRLSGQAGLSATAEGDVEFRRGSLVIRAERMSYAQPEDRVDARGDVRIERPGAVYRGSELELAVQRFEGWFLQPRFEFTQLGSGGRAERVDFLGPGQARALDARYTSCPR
ncbi:MAG: LPS-assembly protein LptD, partial [Comamonadaceae bacterium]|nr:LPS-assembly protein LptD [Comamonadaceae bacterium]